jgi:transposase InsO family protein
MHRPTFATHGLPEIIVSDNESAQFYKFHKFTKINGIHHVTSAAYHPSTNGLAECAVQGRIEEGDIQTRLTRFLFQYRITPHSTTGVCPSELLMCRHLRSHLDLLFPSVESRVHASQVRQRNQHDHLVRDRSWKLEDLVFVKKLLW